MRVGRPAAKDHHRVNLNVRGTVSGMDEQGFEDVAREAEQLCPVSNALRGNVNIQLQTSLAS